MIIYVYRMVKGEKKNTNHPFAADKSRGKGVFLVYLNNVVSSNRD